ncbi:phage tail protein [uncultured Megasphaera sp.]|uniref:TipJ family phage tail tip protein n=1 Tax=uncultured Megasphaera sp. TaxID=165188 RepID=UPI0026708564|nr:phage tail protein [uncultured Megasphaera sp.]
MRHEFVNIPTDTLQIIEIKNPFEPKKETKTVPLTNGTVFSYLNPEGKDIYYNGLYVSNPSAFYPQGGGQLIVMPHIGKSIGKIFGWVAMIALSYYAGAWTKGLFGATFGGALGRALVSGAILYLGGRIINSVFHIDQKNNSSETNYGWNLPTVQTTEGGVIGETFGEVMPTPQLLMEHVETVNSDDQDSNVQYLNMLLCGGWGPVDSIDDIRIDTTPIGNFSDVQIETRLGTNDQSPISLFPDTVLDQNVGMELAQGKTIIRTTETNKAKKLEVTLEFPNGLYYVDDKGNYKNATGVFNILYRKTGTTNWLTPNGANGATTDNTDMIQNLSANESEQEVWTIARSFLGCSVTGSIHGLMGYATPGKTYNNGYISFYLNAFGNATIRTGSGTYSITKGTNSAVRRTYVIPNLDAGQYDVSVTATRLPTGTRYQSYAQWDTLSAYIYDGARSRPGKVLVALRIKATNQLSGSLPNINWRQWRNTVYVWNPTTSGYEEKSARNPIWAAYAILHKCKYIKNINTGNYEYVVEGSAAVNFTQYYDDWVEAAEYADELISNPDANNGTEARFEFDAFYNSTESTWNAAQKAAAVGHAAVIRHGTQYGISVDKPGTICQIFGEGQTTVSTVKGEFASIEDRAKAVEVTYNDTDNDFKNTLMKIYSPKYAADSTVQDNTAKVTLFGVKRRSQAYREAYYYLATNERQLQTVSFGVDIAGIVCQYGDIIGLNHAVPQLGTASGRIVSIEGTTVILDKEITLEAGISYAIMVSLSTSDTILTRAIVGVSEETTTDTLTIAAAFDAATMPTQYDPYAIGVTDKVVKPFIVVKTERTGDNQVTLTGIEYDEAIYDIDYEKYPVVDYTNPTVFDAPTNLALTESNYCMADGTKIHILTANWDVVAGQHVDKFYVYYSEDGNTWKLWGSTEALMAAITDVNPPGTYYVKVCASKSGINSAYAQKSLDMTGWDAPPNDVTGLTATKITSNTTQVKLSWAANTDIDLKGYRVYVNGVLHSNILTDTTYTYTADQSGQYTFAVVAVDNSDNESANQATVTDVITCEPADVTGFTVQQSDADRSIAVFNWAANKEVDLSYYEIRVGDTWDTGIVLVTKTKATTARYTLPSSGSYTFWIKAINAEGFYSANAAQLVEQVTLEPDAVTGLAMAKSTQDKSKATLSWSAPAGGDIAYYAVKYGTSWDAGTLVAKTKEIKLTVALPGNGTWHYMVQAVTVAGYTSTIASTDITASIQPLDVTNFKAIQSATDRTRITLTWDAPVEVDVAYYIIKEGSNWNSAVIVSPRVAGTLYDVVVDDEAQHTWLIKAVTIAGNESQYAASVSGIYDLRPNPVASIQASQDSNNRSILNINWAEVSDGDLSGYQVKIGDNWDAGEPLPFTRELYATYTVTSSGTFKVMIKAMNAAGYYSDEVSIACTVQVEPSNVTGLVAYQNSDTVELYWDKSPDNDVTGYEIREGYSFDSGALVSTGVANTDYTMAIDTARFYHYFVKAINSSGKYSKTAASVSLTVSNLSPRNVIQTFDEIALASGTHDNTEFGTSLINFQTIGGKWSDYPTTKFSEVGGISVLKLAKGSNGNYATSGIYTSAVIDIASIITCNVTTLFTSSVNLKGGSAALQVRTSQDGTTWLDWEGFKPIQRTFRYIQFRILLETTDITKTPEVNQCIVSIDVPDTDIALTATISTGGTTVPYGHTYYTVPAVVPAAIGENLHAELISKTLSDCVIKIKNASNTDVGGTADIRIKGY